VLGLVLLLSGAAGFGWLLAALGYGQTAPAASLEEREQAFVERMEGIFLDGHFTVDWPVARDGKYSDTYEIDRVEKLDGNRWRFFARMSYGSMDTTFPVVVPVVWADDIPMIQLDDLTIPGLGDDFGAMILFHEDHYAGTWKHGEVGGYMFGAIRKTNAEEMPPEE